jgi:hypothetical protein
LVMIRCLQSCWYENMPSSMRPCVCNMYGYYVLVFVNDMCWCFLWYTCIYTYLMMMGTFSYCVLCSCYECSISWVDSVLHKVCVLLSSVHFCKVLNVGSYMSIYATFMCSIVLLILNLWYFSNIFRCFTFFSVLWCSFYILYSHMHVLCSAYLSNILNYRYYFEFPVYFLYIWRKMFGPFALRVLVGIPCI